MGIYIKSMEMPKSCRECRFCNGQANTDYGVCAWCNVDGKARDAYTMQDCPLVPVPEHGRMRKRIVYRGDVFNAIEAARINALDGILTDRYKNGFHDGLKRALEILANEVDDAPAIIPTEEGE